MSGYTFTSQTKAAQQGWSKPVPPAFAKAILQLKKPTDQRGDKWTVFSASHSSLP